MRSKATITIISITTIVVVAILLLQKNKSMQDIDKDLVSDSKVEILVELNTVKQKASYGIGSQIANTVKQQNPDIDANAIALAFKDVLSGNPRLGKNEMRKAIRLYQNKKNKQRKKQGEKNKIESQVYLEENKKKKGVVTTASGLQFKVLRKGDGNRPKANNTVMVNYKGTLINGEEFDSSYNRDVPATLALNRVIKGWSEGMQLMNVGSKFQFFIPPDLGYGERGAGINIPPHTMLIYEVELIEIKTTEHAKSF